MARPQLQIDGTTIDGQVVAGAGTMTAPQILGQSLFSRPGELPSRREGETTAEWLEFEFLYPSGRTEIARRYLFDCIGPAARGSGTESTAALSPLPTNGDVTSLLNGMYVFSFDAGYV